MQYNYHLLFLNAMQEKNLNVKKINHLNKDFKNQDPQKGLWLQYYWSVFVISENYQWNCVKCLERLPPSAVNENNIRDADTQQARCTIVTLFKVTGSRPNVALGFDHYIAQLDHDPYSLTFLFSEFSERETASYILNNYYINHLEQLNMQILEEINI